MDFSFLFRKKKNKVIPDSSSYSTQRVKTQKKFSKQTKVMVQRILSNPWNTTDHLVDNEMELHSRFSLHMEQLSQMMENQKVMLEMSLELLQCHLALTKKKDKEGSASLTNVLSLWKETTRDLYTHFETNRLQQNDLLELQQEDIRKLEKLLSECASPKLKKQQRRQSFHDLQQIFGNS